MVRSVLWHFASLPSMERCTFRVDDNAGSVRVEGTTLTLLDGTPAEIRYGIACDSGWQTRAATIEIRDAHSSKTIEVEVDREQHWTVNGVHTAEFDGLADIDLGFSPATNTLPIQRLALKVGQKARLTTVWFRFPELDIVRSVQVYTRSSESLYHFETGAGDFHADIRVDRSGIVTAYGDLWQELASNDG